MELSEDGSSIGLWGDGAKLGGNNIESIDDLTALLLTSDEVGGILLTLGSKRLFLFSENVELGGNVGNLSG